MKVTWRSHFREQKSRSPVVGPSLDSEWTRKEAQMLSTILLIILVLLLIGALPNWGYSRGWGYGPSGGLGLIVVILLILVLMGRI
jgi:hypothetical protein